MKITYTKWIDILNERLKAYEQNIRVIDFKKKSLTLSNNMILNNNDFSKFKKRILNKKTDLWVKNTDKWLNDSLQEAEIKSKICAIGGISCQKKYKDTIRKNLNNGVPWNKGTKGKNIGKRGPLSQSVKDKISAKNSGKGNGMYGTKLSDIDKKLKSDIMKKKILSGEFTPNSNNRNTHWDSYYNGKKYRSSWEALYQYYNNDAEYEKLRIMYIKDAVEKIYIVDFIDYVNKLVIEVKPSSFVNSEQFTNKKEALYKWAKNNNFEILLVTEDWLIENISVIDYSKFDEQTAQKIKKFYETYKKNRNQKA